ncbi:NADPH-dependent oxidoreductase [Georgenia ruanii]|uniref:NADPH-dependent oxidoreductase n=1 Tax=Georgenia ruanii TaxID=348442 RepID=A0A7J9V0U2_9MICO|nr:NADPH-dependent oxidoreductase [Georgenia ruanii]
MTVVTVSGNPRPDSRTQQLGEQVAAAVAARLGARTALVDLSALAGDLFAPATPALERALETAASAAVLVVATPTYKATYTGLLKAFLDRYGAGGLAGVAAVPVQVAGNPVHLAAADLHLRPVLTELGARVPTRPVLATETQLPEAHALVAEWIATEGPALAALTAVTA